MTQHAMQSMTRQAARRRGLPAAADAVDPRLARGLLGAMFLAVVAMASLPGAREASATFGWMPLWLLAMPASAWLALRLRGLTARARGDVAAVAGRRRRGAPASAPVPGSRRTLRARRTADHARSA
jgi:hypothetical protein